MAKRYSASEKAALLTAYASSGQSMAAFSRSCGVSAITLRSWQQIDGVPEVGGFEAIVNVAVDLSLGFRLTVGNATVECGSLPPAAWVSELLKRLSA